MYNVLVFGDPGIDDSFAIIYALLNPKINLVGIVSGYGNVTQEQATLNVAYLLQLAGREDIPIIGGAKGPLSGELTPFYPEIHGAEGLGPIRPPENLKRELLNFDEIFKIIGRYQNNLTIVDVGRSTSLAITFNLGGQEQIKKVKDFYLMGGAFLVPGNVTATAEANFHGDPIATNLVLEKGHNITITPLNVTNYAIIKPDIIKYISFQKTNKFSVLFKPIFDYYLQFYKKIDPNIEGSPLHDVFTLFALTNPGSIAAVNKEVKVSIFNETRGESVADFRKRQPEKPPKPGTLDRIVLQFKYQDFVQDFTRVMTSKGV